MPRFLWLILALVLSWSAIACTPTPDPSPSVTPASTPEAIEAPNEASSEVPVSVLTPLKQVLIQEHGIAADAITLTRAIAIDWGDSCLGVAQPDELCAQVVTPGYEIEFTTPQGIYIFHSDRTGTAYRLAQSP